MSKHTQDETVSAVACIVCTDPSCQFVLLTEDMYNISDSTYQS